MTRRYAGAIAVAFALGGTSLALAAPAGLERPASARQQAGRLEQPGLDSAVPHGATDMLFQAVNAERARLGLPPFAWHDRTGQAAGAHAADMAAHERLQHTGSDGSDAGTRLRSAGVVTSHWAENLGSGHRDAERLVAAWTASPAHRANLVGNFRYAGVGVAVSASGTPYWVLVLTS